MTRDTIKSLRTEIDALKAEIAALRIHIDRMPQHDWLRPIGPPQSGQGGVGGRGGDPQPTVFPPMRKLEFPESGGRGGASG